MIILNAGKDIEKLHYSYIAGGNVKWYRYSAKYFGKFLQNKICIYHIIEQPHSLISEKWKLIFTPRNLYMDVHSSFIHDNEVLQTAQMFLYGWMV